MSMPVAKHAPDTCLITTAGYVSSAFCPDGVSGGLAKRASGHARMLQREPQLPAGVSADALTNLDALPWLTRTGPSAGAMRDDVRSVQSSNSRHPLLAGIAVALAALCGSAWHLADGPFPQSIQMLTPRNDASAGPSAYADARIAEHAATIGKSTAARGAPSGAQQAVIAGVTGSEAGVHTHSRPAGIKPIAATQTQYPMPGIEPSPTAEQAAITDAAANLAPPEPPGEDSPADAATLKEYRSTVEECRDAIRAVIRLADRQRPGHSASVDEHTSFRLRQQNAEAAKAYRTYLDTLARAMRGAKSETVARQSLERARQTLGYVNAMLADSNASLR